MGCALYHPTIVLIGVQPENICRHVNVFRPFYVAGDNPPLPKPRFIIEANQLKLLPNPFHTVDDYQKLLGDETSTLHELGANDYYYDVYKWNDRWEETPFLRLLCHACYTIRGKRIKRAIVSKEEFSPTSEAFKVTIKIVQTFYALAQSHQATPIILLLPTWPEVDQYLKTGRHHYQGLPDELDRSSLIYIDFMKVFVDYIRAEKLSPSQMQAKKWRDELFMPRGHYSPTANRLVAKFLADRLSSRGGDKS